MDSLQLDTICKRVLGAKFAGVYPFEKLPSAYKTNTMFVFNNQTSNLQGQHWIAVLVVNTIGYVFDSFGMLPPTRIINWLSARCTNWSWNKRKVQSFDSKSCGLFCLYFFYYSTIINVINFDELVNIIFPKTITKHESNVEHFTYNILYN